jgi:hypothetical protein
LENPRRSGRTGNYDSQNESPRQHWWYYTHKQAADAIAGTLDLIHYTYKVKFPVVAPMMELSFKMCGDGSFSTFYHFHRSR